MIPYNFLTKLQVLDILQKAASGSAPRVRWEVEYSWELRAYELSGRFRATDNPNPKVYGVRRFISTDELCIGSLEYAEFLITQLARQMVQDFESMLTEPLRKGPEDANQSNGY